MITVFTRLKCHAAGSRLFKAARCIGQRMMAALATQDAYETRIWDGATLMRHTSASFSEALAWAKCYGAQFGGGVATIWLNGSLVASRRTHG